MATQSRERVTVPSILSRKQSKEKITAEKITALTAYDATFAALLDAQGIDLILVGDSLGTVVQGLATTLPVTLEQMLYHCSCVTRVVSHALVVGDLPFMSYQGSIEKALESAGALVKSGGVAAVKLEGGVPFAETINKIVACEIPVIGHVGLTPQSFHRMGGYKIQGRQSRQGKKGKKQDSGTRERILDDARAVEEAGAFAIVLEGIPAELATEITETLSIPTIGIGAGVGCDGQILVMHDLLGLGMQPPPRFVKEYAHLRETVGSAVAEYIREVKTAEISYSAA